MKRDGISAMLKSEYYSGSTSGDGPSYIDKLLYRKSDADDVKKALEVKANRKQLDVATQHIQ